MQPADYKDDASAFSTEALCQRIFERHRDAIRVRKPHVAVANLARIVEATLKLSNRQGFHATSLRDLAEASGLSMGGLYAYFPNKTTLLAMILGEVAHAAQEALGAPPAAIAGDPRRHLAWLIESHIRLTEVMQPWFVFAFMEAKSFPAAERRQAIDSEAATETMIAEVLRRGTADGVFSIADIDLTAALIKPLLQEWYVKRAKYRRRDTSIETYIATTTNFIMAATRARVSGLSD
ncbi:MAG: TetR/AcrR family transcriptional regulator [Proteobacteria bacterium]|nr:TetR/AcrR family transcriptional regulator [Pseudomonadota bacterium]